MRRLAGACAASAGAFLLVAPSTVSGPVLLHLTRTHGVHVLDVAALAAIAIGVTEAARR